MKQPGACISLQEIRIEPGILPSKCLVLSSASAGTIRIHKDTGAIPHTFQKEESSYFYRMQVELREGSFIL